MDDAEAFAQQLEALAAKVRRARNDGTIINMELSVDRQVKDDEFVSPLLFQSYIPGPITFTVSITFNSPVIRLDFNV